MKVHSHRHTRYDRWIGRRHVILAHDGCASYGDWDSERDYDSEIHSARRASATFNARSGRKKIDIESACGAMGLARNGADGKRRPCRFQASRKHRIDSDRWSAVLPCIRNVRGGLAVVGVGNVCKTVRADGNFEEVQ